MKAVEYQVQVPLGGLPVNLVLVGNQWQGRVAFVKVATVDVIIDRMEKDQVGAVFTEDDIAFFETSHEGEIQSFEYGTIYDYKEIPLMLRWLQQQNLQEPKTVFGE